MPMPVAKYLDISGRTMEHKPFLKSEIWRCNSELIERFELSLKMNQPVINKLLTSKDICFCLNAAQSE